MSIQGYHAHIYFDSQSIESATRLRDDMQAQLGAGVKVSSLRRTAIGPHPQPMFEVQIDNGSLETALSWLMLHHGAHSVLVHPLTDSDLLDHLRHATWLGTPLPLKLEILSDQSIESMVTAWQSTHLPFATWQQHQAHVKVAVWHLLNYDEAEATLRLREGIQRYNAAHGIATTPTGGYHETVTLASIRYILKRLDTLDRTRPIDRVANAILAKFPATKTLLQFYTRDLIMSPEARKTWVEPDIQSIC